MKISRIQIVPQKTDQQLNEETHLLFETQEDIEKFRDKLKEDCYELFDNAVDIYFTIQHDKQQA